MTKGIEQIPVETLKYCRDINSVPALSALASKKGDAP